MQSLMSICVFLSFYCLSKQILLMPSNTHAAAAQKERENRGARDRSRYIYKINLVAPAGGLHYMIAMIYSVNKKQATAIVRIIRPAIVSSLWNISSFGDVHTLASRNCWCVFSCMAHCTYFFFNKQKPVGKINWIWNFFIALFNILETSIVRKLAVETIDFYWKRAFKWDCDLLHL